MGYMGIFPCAGTYNVSDQMGSRGKGFRACTVLLAWFDFDGD